MLNRIYYVLLTYVTRPAVWVLGGLYVVVAIVVANWDVDNNTTHSVAPGLPESRNPLYLADSESIRKFDEGEFDRNIRAAMIYWEGEIVNGVKAERILPDGRREFLSFPAFSTRHLRQLRECPRLRTLALQFRGRLTDDEWQALGDLDQLTAFKYDGEISPLGMRQIARLSKLRFLDLTGCTFEEGLEGLESLEHLQIIVLNNFVENQVHVLGQLRRLSHLQVLVSSNYRTANVTRAVWTSDLGELRAVPRLEWWFVDDMAFGFPGFDALASELPRVAIRPIFGAGVRQWKCIPVVLLTGIMIVLLLLMMSHFVHPAALLTPGYVAPHLIVATMLWLGGLLIPAWWLASAASPMLPLVGIGMAVWLGSGSVGLILNVVGRRRSNAPTWFRRIMVPLQFAALFWFPALLLAAHFNQSSFDWFLRGREPGLAIGLIAAGLACYVLLAWRVVRAQVDFQESGLGTPPLGVDRGQMMAYAEHSVSMQYGAAGGAWPRFDRRLTRATDQARLPGWRRRSNLWIAGNRFDGKQVLLLGLFMVLIIYVTNIALKIWDGRGFELAGTLADWLSTPLLLSCLMFPDFCYLYLGAIWRGRRRWLHSACRRV